MTHDEILSTIAEAFAVAGIIHPMPQIVRSRATSFCGRAIPSKNVLMLTRAWEAATPKGQRRTVIHEAMHLAVAHLYGRHPGGAHGWAWRSLMMKAGIPADRCSNDPGAVAADNLARWRRDRWVFCPCASHLVSPQAFKGYATGRRTGTCRRCRGPISTTPHPPESLAPILQKEAA